MALDPNNARAAQILRELGYELVDETQAQAEPAPAQPEPAQPAYGATYDPEAPLPSYDLDEAPAEQQFQAGSLDQVDDPFATSSEREEEQPLPSFPLDAREASGWPREASGSPALSAPAERCACVSPRPSLALSRLDSGLSVSRETRCLGEPPSW